jgi:hypothetical protein
MKSKDWHALYQKYMNGRTDTQLSISMGVEYRGTKPGKKFYAQVQSNAILVR